MKLFNRLLEKCRLTFFPFLQDSYSQEGEDLLISRYLPIGKKGFYVDIGAHHPKRFSNTYRLYRQGWRGITIEPTPNTKHLFQKMRPLDIHLTMGVGKEAELKTLYEFNDTALNTFEPDFKNRLVNETEYHIIASHEIQIQPLSNILKAHMPREQTIDLLSIDAEGYDMAIIESNDWQQYQPTWILIEQACDSIQVALRLPMTLFLNERGYELRSKLYNTLLFSKVFMS